LPKSSCCWLFHFNYLLLFSKILSYITSIVFKSSFTFIRSSWCTAFDNISNLLFSSTLKAFFTWVWSTNFLMYKVTVLIKVTVGDLYLRLVMIDKVMVLRNLAVIYPIFQMTFGSYLLIVASYSKWQLLVLARILTIDSCHFWQTTPVSCHFWHMTSVSCHFWQMTPVSCRFWHMASVSCHFWQMKPVSCQFWQLSVPVSLSLYF
jgi:hypothetical protein